MNISVTASSRPWQPIWFLLVAAFLGLALVRLPLSLAITLVLAVTLLLLIAIQPLIGLGLALLAGPWGALENVLRGGVLLDSGQLLLLLTLAAWVGRNLLRRRVILPHTSLNVPLLIFIYVATLTLPGAASLEYGIRELLKWVEIGLIVLMVVDVAAERGQSAKGNTGQEQGDLDVRVVCKQEAVDWLLAAVLLAGLSQALIGIWQFGWRSTGPEHFMILGRFYRAYGTFEQPNPFGGFMNITALLAAGVLIGLVVTWCQRLRLALVTSQALPASDERRAMPWLKVWLIFAVSCLVVAVLALVFSWSRGAWLGFTAGTAVLVLFWPKRRWQGIVLLGLAGTLFLMAVQLSLLPAGALERISSFSQDLTFGDVRGADINDANYAVLERLAHWQAALDMARYHPWLGVGFGNYEPAYAGYALINWPDALGHAHNYYLNLLAETGIAGLLAYLVFWMVVFWQTVKVLRQLEWPRRGIALGLLAAWAALSVHHLVDKLYVNNVYIHLGAMLGVLQLLDIETKSKEA